MMGIDGEMKMPEMNRTPSLVVYAEASFLAEKESEGAPSQSSTPPLPLQTNLPLQQQPQLLPSSQVSAMPQSQPQLSQSQVQIATPPRGEHSTTPSSKAYE